MGEHLKSYVEMLFFSLAKTKRKNYQIREKLEFAKPIHENVDRTNRFTDGGLRTYNTHDTAPFGKPGVEWHDPVYRKLRQVEKTHVWSNLLPIDNRGLLLGIRRMERKFFQRKITEAEYNHILEASIDQLAVKYSTGGFDEDWV